MYAYVQWVNNSIPPLTLLQVHVVHFGVLDLLELLAELLGDLLALVVRLDLLLGAWNPESHAATDHNRCLAIKPG